MSLPIIGAIFHIRLLVVTIIILMVPLAAATEQCDKGSEEEQDHRSEYRPHGRAKHSVTTRAIAVDVIFDDSEWDKVCHHNDECKDPSEHCHDRSEQATDDTGAEGKKEGDEGETAADRVKNHYSSETVSRIAWGGAKVGWFDGGHNPGWIVTDVTAWTPVLVGGDGRNIENAVTKSPECNGRIAYVGTVCQGHFQNGNVANDWSRDGGDEEENKCEEEEEGSNMMDDACFSCHCSWMSFSSYDIV